MARRHSASSNKMQNTVPKRSSMEEIMRMPALLDTVQVGSITGETPQSVSKSCASGLYPAVKCGNAWRINKAVLLQKLGLTDEDGREEEKDEQMQESTEINSGNTFDFSHGIKPIIRSRKVDGTYLMFANNGPRNPRNSESLVFSLSDDDATDVISRYGDNVSIRLMPDSHALVLTDGDERTLSRNGKTNSARRQISVNTYRDEIVSTLGKHRKIFMHKETYDNCFVFVPTGEVEDL